MGLNTLTVLNKNTADNKPFEFVERKGMGHPDTLSDGVAEAISIEYSKYCLEHFGIVLHQMLDKIMFMGGMAKADFGIGEMIQPWRLVINGRISKRFGTHKIPFEDIAENAARNYLKNAVPEFNSRKWLKFYHLTSSYARVKHWFSPTSIDDVPDAKVPYSNDTSLSAGFWPLSTTEKLTLLMEKYFYDDFGKPNFMYIGQDIKVLSLRKFDEIDITICVPMFGQYTKTKDEYLERIKSIHDDLSSIARNFVNDKYKVNISLNTQDNKANKEKKSIGYYLVASGSALDSGEEGMVGRGNRSRGIISSVRSSTMEAINGKNPVYYVGKVYNYVADKLAKKISEDLECECSVFISSRNSDLLSKPRAVFVELNKKRNKSKVKKIIEEEFKKGSWTMEILEGRPFIPFPGGGHAYRSFLPLSKK